MKAAELLGGRAELARTLQISIAEIERWIAGDTKPPRETFLRIVDIILDETSASASDDTDGPTHERDAAGSTRYVD